MVLIRAQPLNFLTFLGFVFRFPLKLLAYFSPQEGLQTVSMGIPNCGLLLPLPSAAEPGGAYTAENHLFLSHFDLFHSPAGQRSSGAQRVPLSRTALKVPSEPNSAPPQATLGTYCGRQRRQTVFYVLSRNHTVTHPYVVSPITVHAKRALSLDWK